MILIDLIEKRMKMFSLNPEDFMSFYDAFNLSILYYPIEERPKFEEKVKRALRLFYYEALKEALRLTSKKENEIDMEWEKKVKEKYQLLRYKAFIYLTEKARIDMKVILGVIGESLEREEELKKGKFDTNKTWLVRYV